MYAFEDARTVLDAVSFENMDLIVTDLDMPMPGDEVITRLRKNGVLIPILVTASNPTEDTCRHLLALGAQEIIRKPFDLNDLLTAATRYLGRTEILVTSRTPAERLEDYEHRPFIPAGRPEPSPN